MSFLSLTDDSHEFDKLRLLLEPSCQWLRDALQGQIGPQPQLQASLKVLQRTFASLAGNAPIYHRPLVYDTFIWPVSYFGVDVVSTFSGEAVLCASLHLVSRNTQASFGCGKLPLVGPGSLCLCITGHKIVVACTAWEVSTTHVNVQPFNSPKFIPLLSHTEQIILFDVKTRVVAKLAFCQYFQQSPGNLDPFEASPKGKPDILRTSHVSRVSHDVFDFLSTLVTRSERRRRVFLVILPSISLVYQMSRLLKKENRLHHIWKGPNLCTPTDILTPPMEAFSQLGMLRGVRKPDYSSLTQLLENLNKPSKPVFRRIEIQLIHAEDFPLFRVDGRYQIVKYLAVCPDAWSDASLRVLNHGFSRYQAKFLLPAPEMSRPNLSVTCVPSPTERLVTLPQCLLLWNIEDSLVKVIRQIHKELNEETAKSDNVSRLPLVSNCQRFLADVTNELFPDVTDLCKLDEELSLGTSNISSCICVIQGTPSQRDIFNLSRLSLLTKFHTVILFPDKGVTVKDLQYVFARFPQSRKTPTLMTFSAFNQCPSLIDYCEHQCRLSRNHTGACDCKEEVQVLCPHCRYSQSVPCSAEISLKPCSRPCEETLLCGHKCSGSCGECYGGKLHLRCPHPCGQILSPCGHLCPKTCHSVCDPCSAPCTLQCDHSSCPNLCGFPCRVCHESRMDVCKHGDLREDCCSNIDGPWCEKPCQRILDCNHSCLGLCGTFACPQSCLICNNIDEVFYTEKTPGAKFLRLTCGHEFEISGLTTWWDHQSDSASNKDILPLPQCPMCRKTVVHGDPQLRRILAPYWAKYENKKCQSFIQSQGSPIYFGLPDVSKFERPATCHVENLGVLIEWIHTYTTNIEYQEWLPTTHLRSLQHICDWCDMLVKYEMGIDKKPGMLRGSVTRAISFVTWLLSAIKSDISLTSQQIQDAQRELAKHMT